MKFGNYINIIYYIIYLYLCICILVYTVICIRGSLFGPQPQPTSASFAIPACFTPAIQLGVKAALFSRIFQSICQSGPRQLTEPGIATSQESKTNFAFLWPWGSACQKVTSTRILDRRVSINSELLVAKLATLCWLRHRCRHDRQRATRETTARDARKRDWYCENSLKQKKAGQWQAHCHFKLKPDSTQMRPHLSIAWMRQIS